MTDNSLYDNINIVSVKVRYVKEKENSQSYYYRDENGNIYTDEQKGELIDEIYTIMFTDAEGDKYISYMVVNIENAEFKTEFKPVLNGKPVKVSAVAKVGYFPSSEYSTLNYYETIYASVKKYVKSENAKETQDEKLTYICETKEQYDTYVQNFAQAELSNKKNVSVVCFVIAGIFMILFILVRRVKSNPEKATEEAKAPSRKKYGADANLDDASEEELKELEKMEKMDKLEKDTEDCV